MAKIKDAKGTWWLRAEAPLFKMLFLSLIFATYMVIYVLICLYFYLPICYEYLAFFLFKLLLFVLFYILSPPSFSLLHVLLWFLLLNFTHPSKSPLNFNFNPSTHHQWIPFTLTWARDCMRTRAFRLAKYLVGRDRIRRKMK